MHRVVKSAATLLCVAATAWSLPTAEGDSPEIQFFEKKIRPVLVEHCYECHSAKAKEIEAGLVLDTRAGLLEGGAVVAGNAEASLLIQAIRYGDLEMPPDGKLSEKVIADFVKWVKMGTPTAADDAAPTVREAEIDWAEARRFWSFQPIGDPAPPEVQDASWPKSSIDYFVLAKLEQRGLRPVESADKRTLLRRATFDLIGLPPTIDQIDVFLNDDSPGAFARAVDRLLDSPHYGERWARHWLDVARYGEDQAHSFKPRLYPSGFRYRDWVVGALNEDMPYDRFIMEQIAGDLLDGPGRAERLPALGFFALGPVYYGDKLKFDQLDDRIDTLTRAFLGLTVACARCHDHKYDPIPTEDYYSLAGIFASSEYTEAPLVPQKVVDRYNQAQSAIKAEQEKIDQFLQAEAARLKVSKEKKEQVERKLSGEAKQQLASLRSELERLKSLSPAMYPVAHSLKEGSNLRNLQVNIRGNPKTPGKESPRRFLAILSEDGAAPFSSGSGRLELAKCIATPDNPLTARVAVNRVWQHHFGAGLVGTTSNFGARGQRPSHPLLLDHLASRFIAQGWSLKTLHRDLMLSATYRLSSRYDGANFQRDPQNKQLWRMNRRRLEVEAWRDAMLAVSGSLDRSLGGESADLASSDNKRRTLYGKISRHDLDSLLRLFDFPDPNITAGVRSETVVPLQQLFVLNSDFLHHRAKALVARLTAGNSVGDAEQLHRAYMLVYGRSPTEREIERGLAFLGDSPPDAEGSAETVFSQWQQYAQALLSANEFMYLD